MSSNQPGSTQHDADLTLAVCDSFDRHVTLRIWKHSIHVQAKAGTVMLTGAVRSQSDKEIAEKSAQGVKGVTAVENQLVVDSDLELAIAQALAADSRTLAGFPGILIGVVFGVAYLKGTAPTAEIKKVAGEIASQIAGVLRISNELIVPAKVQAAA
jgi:hyperosmotically inducible periplasmic protein